MIVQDQDLDQKVKAKVENKINNTNKILFYNE